MGLALSQVVSFLRYEQHDGVVTLTMDEPETRNALTGNTAIEEFVDAAQRIARDESVRAVVITGNGPVFCSGGNVKDMKRLFEEQTAPSAIMQEYRHGIQQLSLAIYTLEVPSIAAINGPAIGAGCDLACMCDIRIASEKATFAESFIKVGIVPGDGGAWLLQRIVGRSRAAEMSFTGEAINAEEALACGLVSRVVPESDLLAQANQLAQRIAANSGPALRMTKRLMREGEHMTFRSLLEMSASYQALAHKTVQHRDAVNSFIVRRR